MIDIDVAAVRARLIEAARSLTAQYPNADVFAFAAAIAALDQQQREIERQTKRAEEWKSSWFALDQDAAKLTADLAAAKAAQAQAVTAARIEGFDRGWDDYHDWESKDSMRTAYLVSVEQP